MSLSESDKQQITAGIRKVEAETRAELVTVICRSSDNYLYIPVLWAALVGLVLPAIILQFDIVMTNAEQLLLQMCSFIICVLLFRYKPVKMMLVPKYIQYERAHRHAQELFYIEGLHLASEHMGVMLFVSSAEKYVEIMTDTGIKEKVDDEEWQEIIDVFVDKVRRQKTAQGYLDAIEQCGTILKMHFPENSKSKTEANNQLPDHLIEM